MYGRNTESRTRSFFPSHSGRRLSPSRSGGRLNPDHVTQGGEDIQQIAERLGGFALRNAGTDEDQRDAHAVLKHALLAQQAVAAQRESVVGGIDDDGVVRLAGLFQGFENPPDLAVQVRDRP